MTFWSFFSTGILLIRSWSNKPLGSIPNPKTVIVYHWHPHPPLTQACILKQSHPLGSRPASPFLFTSKAQLWPASIRPASSLCFFVQRNILVSFPTFQTRNSGFSIVLHLCFVSVLWYFDLHLKQLYLLLYILSLLSLTCAILTRSSNTS